METKKQYHLIQSATCRSLALYSPACPSMIAMGTGPASIHGLRQTRLVMLIADISILKTYNFTCYRNLSTHRRNRLTSRSREIWLGVQRICPTLSLFLHWQRRAGGRATVSLTPSINGHPHPLVMTYWSITINLTFTGILTALTWTQGHISTLIQ